jgi:DNA end-binding protein Ku
MVLETLLWPDEIRQAEFDFLDQDVEVRSQELKMASSLIDSMTVDFDPSLYRDGYRDALEELVAAKVQGHEVVRPQLKVEEGGGSLADALKASLAAAKAGSGATDGNGKRQAQGKASA